MADFGYGKNANEELKPGRPPMRFLGWPLAGTNLSSGLLRLETMISSPRSVASINFDSHVFCAVAGIRVNREFANSVLCRAI